MSELRGGSLPQSKNMMGNLLMELRDSHLKKAKIIPVLVDEDVSKGENDFEEGSEEDSSNADVNIGGSVE